MGPRKRQVTIRKTLLPPSSSWRYGSEKETSYYQEDSAPAFELVALWVRERDKLLSERLCSRLRARGVMGPRKRQVTIRKTLLPPSSSWRYGSEKETSYYQ